MWLSTWNNGNQTSGHQNLGVAQMHWIFVVSSLSSYNTVDRFCFSFSFSSSFASILLFHYPVYVSFEYGSCVQRYGWKEFILFECVSASNAVYCARLRICEAAIDLFSYNPNKNQWMSCAMRTVRKINWKVFFLAPKW